MPLCQFCGRSISSRGISMHERFCPDNPECDKNAEEVDQVDWSQENQASEPASVPSFPASMCPDVLILKDNSQMFFKVTGRRIGDRVYVEDVKMLR